MSTPKGRQGWRSQRLAPRVKGIGPGTPAGIGWDEAESRARALLGPRASIKFGPRLPAMQRYMVGGVTKLDDGRKVFGVIGAGPTWELALADAQLRKLEVEHQREGERIRAAANVDLGEDT